jgi:hypothetical protein
MAEEGTQREADVQSNEGLSEETECGERRYAGAVLVWDNRESQMANPPEIEPSLFVLKSGSCRAEVVLLN